MKKKLLTLCALLFGITGAYAVEDETIFLWQSDGSTTSLETSLTATGGTAAFYGTEDVKTESVKGYNEVVTDEELKSTGKNAHKLGANTLYLKITLNKKLQADDVIYICGYNALRVGTGVTSNRADTDIAESLATGTGQSDFSIGSIIVPNTIGDNVTEIYISRTNSNSTDLAAVKIVRPAPTTDPVINAEGTTIKVKKSGDTATEEITISGKNLTGKTLSATLKDVVDGLDVALTDNAISGGTISTTAKLTYTPTADAKGTTTLTLSDGVTSKEVTINYIAKLTYAKLETISEATTWDFTNDVTGSVQFSTNEDKKTEYVYADLADLENLIFAETFNAKALAFTGTYPVRDSKYAQAGTLHFKTSVPGKLEVSFSNTGNNSARYVIVNETQGSEKTEGTTAVSESFDIEDDEVTISGTSDIRYYKLVFTPVTKIDVTIDNGTGYRTFASKFALDFTDVEGLTAYTANVSGDEVSFKEVKDVVAAGTGLLLKGGDNTYTIPVATSDAGGVTSDLVGVTTEGQIASKGDFVLMNEEKGVGFYKITADEFTLTKNTAYLPADNNALAGANISYIAIPGLGGDGTTSLKAIENKVTEDGKLYDLQGRQVTNPAKGLYIKNGKKYIVK